VAAGTALPIPNPLTANWTAPPGSYTMPATVPVDRAVTVDLSAATVTGSDGYLFTLRNGGRLTVVGGALRGPILGLVHDTVTAAGTGSVTITDTSLTDVRCIVCADGPGGPIDAELTGVRATGLGDGVRAVTNALDVDRTVLTGGGAPPLGSPAGLHSLDDAAGNVAVAARRLTVSNSTITGFTSAKFQGDSIIGETRVASADIENNTLGHNSDSGGVDSKIRSVTFTGNTVYSDGYRGVVSHYGTLTASGNTIYQVARSARGQPGQAYQATGTLNATGDTVVLGAGAVLAFATYAATGRSAPSSTFPRVGAITLSGITDRNGARLTGPTRIKAGSGYHPTIVIN
jgi:hypothetical protein